MAQVAVNKDGTEVIGESLHKAYYKNISLLSVEGDYGIKNQDIFDRYVSIICNIDGCREDISVELPKGTIFKLIGRELTFEDGAVELQ